MVRTPQVWRPTLKERRLLTLPQPFYSHHVSSCNTPRQHILSTLRSKHPTEVSAAISNGKAWAEQRAGTIAVDEEAKPEETREPLNFVQHIPEV